MILGAGSTACEANVLFLINIWADMGRVATYEQQRRQKYACYNKY